MWPFRVIFGDQNKNRKTYKMTLVLLSVNRHILTKNCRVLSQIKRFCSSDNQHDNSRLNTSNLDLPSFTTMGSHYSDFKEFTKMPSPTVILMVMAFGTPAWGGFVWKTPDGGVDKMSGQSLLDGSLYAVERVANALASPTTELSSLNDLLTPECISQLKRIINNSTLIPNSNVRATLGIDKDDVGFSWIHSMDFPNREMKLVAVSFPAYGYLYGLKGKVEEHQDHVLIKNELVMSNWHFVLDDQENWKIKGVAMSKISTVLSNFYFIKRWQARLILSLKAHRPMVRVIRWDYLSDYIVFSIFTFFFVRGLV